MKKSIFIAMAMATLMPASYSAHSATKKAPTRSSHTAAKRSSGSSSFVSPTVSPTTSTDVVEKAQELVKNIHNLDEQISSKIELLKENSSKLQALVEEREQRGAQAKTASDVYAKTSGPIKKRDPRARMEVAQTEFKNADEKYQTQKKPLEEKIKMLSTEIIEKRYERNQQKIALDNLVKNHPDLNEKIPEINTLPATAPALSAEDKAAAEEVVKAA